MTKPKPKELLKKRGRKPKNPVPHPEIQEIRDIPAQVQAENKGGRPHKLIADEITVEKVKMLAQLCATPTEAANYFGVKYDTFMAFLERHPQVFEIWEKGRAETKLSVRRAQIKKAVKDGNPEMLKWLGRQLLEQTDKTLVENTGKDGAPILHAHTIKLSDEDRRAILDLLD